MIPRRVYAPITAILLLLLATGSVAQSAASVEILLYDPDTNHQALKNMTALFNAYLKAKAPNVVLRPIKDREVFDRLVKQESSGFAIVSAAYLKDTRRRVLRPVLVPESGGSTKYRKLLLDREGGPKGDFSHKTIAMTIVESDVRRATRRILRQLAAAGLGVKNTQIQRVSKDVDALLALAFGRVAGALVTENTFEVLKRVNQQAVQGLRVVHETPASLRAPLCVVANHAPAEQVERLVGAFRAMADDPLGSRALDVMSADSWVPFSPAMLE